MSFIGGMKGDIISLAFGKNNVFLVNPIRFAISFDDNVCSVVSRLNREFINGFLKNAQTKTASADSPQHPARTLRVHTRNMPLLE